MLEDGSEGIDLHAAHSLDEAGEFSITAGDEIMNINNVKAAAMLDGWKQHPDYDDVMTKGMREAHVESANIQEYWTSYDAIIPVVKKCWEDGLFAPEKFYQAIPNYYPHLLSFFQHSSPAQLCEALIKATGKWKD